MLPVGCGTRPPAVWGRCAEFIAIFRAKGFVPVAKGWIGAACCCCCWNCWSGGGENG